MPLPEVGGRPQAEVENLSESQREVGVKIRDGSRGGASAKRREQPAVLCSERAQWLRTCDETKFGDS